jgi:hypothetical protein
VTIILWGAPASDLIGCGEAFWINNNFALSAISIIITIKITTTTTTSPHMFAIFVFLF